MDSAPSQTHSGYENLSEGPSMHLFRPSIAWLQTFRASQTSSKYTYADVGASDAGHPAGFTLDHNRICLGQGAQVFEAACTALRSWRMFPASWTAIYPPDCPQTPGAVVVMLAHALGLWWPNALRIVDRIDEIGRRTESASRMARCPRTWNAARNGFSSSRMSKDKCGTTCGRSRARVIHWFAWRSPWRGGCSAGSCGTRNDRCRQRYERSHQML